MAKSKLARYRRARKARANPETKKAATEMAINIGAGFAGYGATRFAARVGYMQAVKRWPKASRHVHVAASALGAAGVYFGSRYWGKVDDYHEAATIGAGIALIQSAVAAYLPAKLAYVVADVDPSQYSTKKTNNTLPAADMSLLLGPSESETSFEPDFDLDALLAENPEVEAVPIGQMEAAPEEDGSTGIEFALGDGDDLADLENYNGMLN